MIKAYAAHQPGGELQPWEFDPGPLGPGQVEIEVEYCGICHSDLSMLNNDWGLTKYPFIPGHEVVGRVRAWGEGVERFQSGQSVGLGWYSKSCMNCQWCMAGDHNLCATAEGTIVGRPGGFANRVRADQHWVLPLPAGMNLATAGPLFCGGLTVFNPLMQLGVKPTDRVGVIGIGGLGHMALGFLKAWGCHVTAFSSSPDKEAEAKVLGAHQFVNSRDPQALAGLVNSLDLILSTVNVPLEWDTYIQLLRPRGKLHLVGAVLQPLSLSVFPLLTGQKSLSASPLGSPVTATQMLEFAARHGIEPMTEVYPMEEANQGIDRLKSGKARYRVVLKA